MIPARATWRQLAVAARTLLLLTLVAGVGYPLLVTGIARAVAPAQADGSPVTDRDGRVVGSALLGQAFTDAAGDPLPRYFQPRPSATGYDAAASSGSNLGPENPDLVASIEQRRAQVAAFEGVAPAAVPADAVTASASGLDPDISPAYARLQVPRVAAARGLPEQRVADLVEATIAGRELGFLGEPTVDVLALNLALDDLEG